VSVDLTIISEHYSTQIRKLAAQRFGFEEEAMMIHATQTHITTAFGYFLLSDDFKGIPAECSQLRGSDERYNSFILECIVKAIELAYADRR